MDPRRPNGRGGQGGRRSTSASLARQGAAPYSRPVQQRVPSTTTTTAATADAPSQLSIRGASSLPTQVLVANLAQGTSSEDVRQTFLQFGDIIRVRESAMAQAQANGGGASGSSTGPSVAYEVLFEDKKSALKAVEQLHGALADGRILAVTVQADTTIPAPSSAAPPTRPRAQQQQQLQPQPQQQQVPAAPRQQPRRELLKPSVSARQAAGALAIPGTRLLTARERKALMAAQQQQQQGRAAGGPSGKQRLPAGSTFVVQIPAPAQEQTRKNGGANAKALKGAQGKAAAQAQTPSLKDRLGGLPLAQRLGGVKGAASDLTTLEANKSKKAARKAKVAAAAAATAGAGAGTGASRKRKANRGKKAAGGAAGGGGGGGGGGMELD